MCTMNYRTFQHLLQMVAGVVCQFNKSICAVFACEVLSANFRMRNVEIDRVLILQILIKPVFRSLLFCVITLSITGRQTHANSK